MAFRNSTFLPVGNQSGRNHAGAKYIYRTSDTMATLTTAGYFDSIKSKLSVGDKIELEFVTFVSATDDNFTGDLDSAMLAVVFKDDNAFVVREYFEGMSYLIGTMTDVSTAGGALGAAATDGNVDLVAPMHGMVVGITSVLNGAITVGNAVITAGNDDTTTNFNNDDFTIAFATSGAGTIDGSTPNAANSVASGETIRLVSDGGSTTVTSATFIVEFAASAASNRVFLQTEISDISGANGGWVVSPVAGTIVSIRTVIDTAITVADAVLTADIDGAAITGGVVTIASAASAAGTKDVVFPTAANVVSAGEGIHIVSDGGSTTASKAVVVFEIAVA